MTKRQVYARLVVAVVLVGVPALAGSSSAATPSASGWTDIPHGHPHGQTTHLYRAWSDGVDVWAAGYRRIDIQGTIEYRTWVQRCDSSAGTCELENTRDIETRPADTRTMDVTGTSASDVWVVGAAKQLSGGTGPLTEHWDGSDWSIVPTPVELGSLAAISAVSAQDVWAVGTERVDLVGGGWIDKPLVLRWDGTVWTRDTVTVRGCDRDMPIWDIDATGPRPLAIGYCYGERSAKTIILSRNAHGWHQETIEGTGPRRHLLVTSIGWTGRTAWAIARFGSIKWKGTMLRADGRTWSPVETPPTIGIPSDIAGTQGDDVWVVGSKNFLFTTMHWNGTRWKSVADPGDGQLFGTAIAADGTPWAVGESAGQSVVQRYDGPLASPR